MFLCFYLVGLPPVLYLLGLHLLLLIYEYVIHSSPVTYPLSPTLLLLRNPRHITHPPPPLSSISSLPILYHLAYNIIQSPPPLFSYLHLIEIPSSQPN